MTYRPSVPTLTPLTLRYDAFLFAPVCNDANGMSLSVVSALARANVDPWEEATRLASMPRALAERALAATLDLIPDRNWKSAEARTIAARLVQLLPQPGEGEPVPVQVVRVVTQQKSYWWLWVAVAIAISVFLAQRQSAKTTDPGVAPPQTSVAPAANAPDVDTKLPGGPDFAQ